MATSNTLQMAVKQHQAGRDSEAESLCQQVLQIQPENPEALGLLATIAHQADRFEDAESLYQQVLQVQPENAIAHEALAELYLKQSRFKEVIQWCQSILQRHPHRPKAHYHMAKALQARSQFKAAAASYSQVIRLKPDWPEAHNNLGAALQAQGEFEAALACYRQAIDLKPDLAMAHNNLGIVLQQQGQFNAAIASYRQTLMLKPDWFLAHYNLGNALQQQGQFEEAITCYQNTLQLNPNLTQAHNNLGNLLQQQGQFEEAIACYQRAIRLTPNWVQPHYNLGNVFKQQGRFKDAIPCYHQTLKLKPSWAEAHNNLGKALQMQGKLEEAIQFYRRTLRLKPDYIEAHNNLGDVLQMQGKLEEAIPCYHQVLKLKPNYAEAYNNLGNALKAQGKSEEAMACYQSALKGNPNLAEAHNNLGNEFKAQGKLEEAIASYQKALSLKPDYAQAKFGICMSQLPIIYSSLDEIQLRRERYQEHLNQLAQGYQTAQPSELKQGAEAVGSFQPFFLAYQGLNDRALQQTYGETIARLMASRYPQWSQPIELPKLEANDKIRVGIVSGFFRNHANWKIPIQGWVENLNRDRFELFGYYTDTKQDAETEKAARSFAKFVGGSKPLEQWCEVIRQDQLHVLIFPEFGMDPTTVRLGCLRLAPIQMTSWGHPETSGLPTIDYYLSSDLMEPERARDCYSETLVRLPNLSIHYTPLEIEPKPRTKKEIGIEEDEVMFWCCQSLYKYLPEHDDVFPRIAQELGHCKFVFISNASEQVSEVFRGRLSRGFENFGLNHRDYCIFLPRMDIKTFAGTTAMADVFLDSIGWSGCNSTLQSLDYNLPIVTWPGALMRGRHTVAMLEMMGIDETIAASKEDYIQMAVRLGQDGEYRQEIAQKVAKNKHKLYGDLEPIRAFEEFLGHAVKSLRS